ncbi:MAG: sodium:proton antiporter [Phycisphaerales bacterium]|nr:sodium:proton antiporter [Planctomycetota bacterium]MBL6997639.1 sodium:proton antiporter [Phycisphaerales bacterium]
MPHYWYFGILPFIAILGAIAVLPLLNKTRHWWESNLNRFFIAMLCAVATIGYMIFTSGSESIGPMLNHAIMKDFIPFIILLFSLYVISGGIYLSGDLAASPRVNTTFLAIGAGIASFIGTTGASMLLIRPLLKTNSQRKYKVHTIVVFIFLVSNIGGTLLPIGDPPLFLGYLRGVPFMWTLGLWPMWAATCGVLLAMYFIWDSIMYRKESAKDNKRDETQLHPLRLQGGINFLWIGGIVATAALVDSAKPLIGTDWTPFPYCRELIMLLFVVLSLQTTSKAIHKANNFTYEAILEVAALFSGIFIAMQVPLAVLGASGKAITETMNQPWHFFWSTGSLSSFLDNAPTYVVFFELSKSLPEGEMLQVNPINGVDQFVPIGLLIAISLGSVFMGAMTYIGNGPNFMVKAIAEQEGVEMPSFFGYMFKYSIPVLIPIFILVTIFFLL